MWLGDREPYLDQPDTRLVGPVIVGRYGGNVRAGADKNEDGILVIRSPDGNWEFAVIVDAHTSSESAELVLSEVAKQLPGLESILDGGGPGEALRGLQNAIDGMFRNASFLKSCKNVRGECSSLIVCRKGRYLWWHSIGDCMLFAVHPDLSAFGQAMLNQRNFFEWVGRENTFDDEVPCYSSGIRRLRPGMNLLIMATDGFVEPGIDYVRAIEGWHSVLSLSSDSLFELRNRIGDFLQVLHRAGTRDSTTLLAWTAMVE